MKKLNWIKYAKLLIGTVLAIIIANILSLEYAYATGIITLLTIQDTKRETVLITVKRIVIFLAMTLLSLLIFPLIGYNLWGFTLVMVPYLFLCLFLEMKEAIAPIAVLCTHYVSSGSCSITMIGNELLILLIGAGIGVIFNLFLSDNTNLIHKQQYQIEERMKGILSRMAHFIQVEDKASYNGECFAQLDHLLLELETQSRNYINNHFLGNNDYFYEYMRLRKMQCGLLKRIYTDITRIEMVPEQAAKISEFFSTIAKEFHETNNAIGLLLELDELDHFFDNEPLPSTREEFENRALLYHILEDLQEFVQLKKDFAMQYYHECCKVQSLSN